MRSNKAIRSSKIVLVAALVAWGPAAVALPTLMASFRDYYKIDKNSNLGKANCVVCHVKGGFKLNPYGLDLKAAMTKFNVKNLTPDVLKSVEQVDSDKDGVKNIDEIKADTFPGDPTSKPAPK